MMGVVNSTRVIDRILTNLIHRLKDKAILFIPLGLSLAKQMRANRAFAVGLIILGSYTGFMSSPVNTLTTILGQEIGGLVPYSSAGLRTVVTIINLAIVSVYLIMN